MDISIYRVALLLKFIHEIPIKKYLLPPSLRLINYVNVLINLNKEFFKQKLVSKDVKLINKKGRLRLGLTKKKGKKTKLINSSKKLKTIMLDERRDFLAWQ